MPCCPAQAELAKRIMFDQLDQGKEEVVQRKGNRRETWCPGRSAWAPPVPGECRSVPAVIAACWPGHWQQQQTHAIRVDPAADAVSGGRKRPLHSMGPIDEDCTEPLLEDEEDGPQPSAQRVRHEADAGKSLA
jgi:hypothetical protein